MSNEIISPQVELNEDGEIIKINMVSSSATQYNPLDELQRLCKRKLYYKGNNKEVQSFLISNGGKIYATEAFTQDISDIDQYLFEYLYLDDLTLLDITDKIYTKQP